jgi:hypothetical protein
MAPDAGILLQGDGLGDGAILHTHLGVVQVSLARALRASRR